MQIIFLFIMLHIWMLSKYKHMNNKPKSTHIPLLLNYYYCHSLLVLVHGAKVCFPPEVMAAGLEQLQWGCGGVHMVCWVTWGWGEIHSFFTLQRCCSPGPTDCPIQRCGTFQQTRSHYVCCSTHDRLQVALLHFRSPFINKDKVSQSLLNNGD